eukprot:m.9597 g.9597  ORF g.9597 m.9597 type:complete len:1171 (+) comp3496_c0_seq1:153-3665(+)
MQRDDSDSSVCKDVLWMYDSLFGHDGKLMKRSSQSSSSPSMSMASSENQDRQINRVEEILDVEFEEFVRTSSIPTLISLLLLHECLPVEAKCPQFPPAMVKCLCLSQRLAEEGSAFDKLNNLLAVLPQALVSVDIPSPSSTEPPQSPVINNLCSLVWRCIHTSVIMGKTVSLAFEMERFLCTTCDSLFHIASAIDCVPIENRAHTIYLDWLRTLPQSKRTIHSIHCMDSIIRSVENPVTVETILTRELIRPDNTATMTLHSTLKSSPYHSSNTNANSDKTVSVNKMPFPAMMTQSQSQRPTQQPFIDPDLIATISLQQLLDVFDVCVTDMDTYKSLFQKIVLAVIQCNKFGLFINVLVSKIPSTPQPILTKQVQVMYHAVSFSKEELVVGKMRDFLSIAQSQLQALSDAQSEQELHSNVLSLLNAYAKNGNKLPSELLETLIFKRIFFLKNLLPVLVKIGVSPSKHQTIAMNLLSALINKKKITQEMVDKLCNEIVMKESAASLGGEEEIDLTSPKKRAKFKISTAHKHRIATSTTPSNSIRVMDDEEKDENDVVFVVNSDDFLEQAKRGVFVLQSNYEVSTRLCNEAYVGLDALYNNFNNDNIDTSSTSCDGNDVQVFRYILTITTSHVESCMKARKHANTWQVVQKLLHKMWQVVRFASYFQEVSAFCNEGMDLNPFYLGFIYCLASGVCINPPTSPMPFSFLKNYVGWCKSAIKLCRFHLGILTALQGILTQSSQFMKDIGYGVVSASQNDSVGKLLREDMLRFGQWSQMLFIRMIPHSEAIIRNHIKKEMNMFKRIGNIGKDIDVNETYVGQFGWVQFEIAVQHFTLASSGNDIPILNSEEHMSNLLEHGKVMKVAIVDCCLRILDSFKENRWVLKEVGKTLAALCNQGESWIEDGKDKLCEAVGRCEYPFYISRLKFSTVLKLCIGCGQELVEWLLLNRYLGRNMLLDNAFNEKEWKKLYCVCGGESVQPISPLFALFASLSTTDEVEEVSSSLLSPRIWEQKVIGEELKEKSRCKYKLVTLLFSFVCNVVLTKRLVGGECINSAMLSWVCIQLRELNKLVELEDVEIFGQVGVLGCYLSRLSPDWLYWTSFRIALTLERRLLHEQEVVKGIFEDMIAVKRRCISVLSHRLIFEVDTLREWAKADNDDKQWMFQLVDKRIEGLFT